MNTIALLIAELLYAVLFTEKTLATKFIFDDNQQSIGIQNCTGCRGSQCNRVSCSCTFVDWVDLKDLAGSASGVSWWNEDELEICCQSQTSQVAQEMLGYLLDFSYTPKLRLILCDHLTTTDGWFVIYGLQELFVAADSSSAHPQNTFDLQAENIRDFSHLSQEYRDHHIVFLGSSTLKGEAKMRSWSIVNELHSPNFSQTVAQAVARSPDAIRAKADGKFMWTTLYGV